MSRLSNQKIDIALQKASGNVDKAVKYATAPQLAEHIGQYCSPKFLYYLNEQSSKEVTVVNELSHLADFGLDGAQIEKASKMYKISSKIGGTFGILLGIVIGAVFFSDYESFLGAAIVGILLPGIPLAFATSRAFQSIYLSRSSIIKGCVSYCRMLQGYARGNEEFWHSLSWRDFEEEIAKLFMRSGFRAYATPASNDRGVDVMAFDDDGIIAIQCKKYSRAVGPAPVRELLGAIQAEGARLGILISSSGFSQKAYECTRNQPLILLDLQDLLSLQGAELKTFLAGGGTPTI